MLIFYAHGLFMIQILIFDELQIVEQRHFWLFDILNGPH